MNKFPKSEILRNKATIKELFAEGHSFNCFPLRVIYLIKPRLHQSDGTQVLFTVPRRSFKKAVDRNTIRRRIKEAYRLNKQVLKQPDSKVYLQIGYIYIGKKIEDYQTIADKLKQSLKRLTAIAGDKD